MTTSHHDIAASIQRALRQAEHERDQAVAVVRGVMTCVCRKGEVEKPPGVSGQEIVERVRTMAMQYVANGRRLTAVSAAAQAMVAHLGPCEVDAAGICQAHWRDPRDQCPVQQATLVMGAKPGVN